MNENTTRRGALGKFAGLAGIAALASSGRVMATAPGNSASIRAQEWYLSNEWDLPKSGTFGTLAAATAAGNSAKLYMTNLYESGVASAKLWKDEGCKTVRNSLANTTVSTVILNSYSVTAKQYIPPAPAHPINDAYYAFTIRVKAIKFLFGPDGNLGGVFPDAWNIEDTGGTDGLIDSLNDTFGDDLPGI
jgi:hypothetical protein